MNIAICDDDLEEVQSIYQFLNPFTQAVENISVSSFDSGEKLIQAIGENSAFDLIFLDIQMKTLNGIDTAKQIRKADNDVLIIFITNFFDFAIRGYEVGAFRYLTKPINSDKFDEAVKAALSVYIFKNQKYIVQSKSETCIINIKDIVYLESQKHEIILHTSKRTYTFYSNFACEEKKLSIYNFIRVHKSFIVNMNYIEIIREKDIVLNNGQFIPFSRNKKQEVWESFHKFLAFR